MPLLDSGIITFFTSAAGCETNILENVAAAIARAERSLVFRPLAGYHPHP